MSIKLDDVEYFTSKEICEIYSITNQTLQYWRKKGLNHFSNSIRKIYYTKKDIQDFLLGESKCVNPVK
jgi:DNA-binding transcriptional MerR regulator